MRFLQVKRLYRYISRPLVFEMLIAILCNRSHPISLQDRSSEEQQAIKDLVDEIEASEKIKVVIAGVSQVNRNNTLPTNKPTFLPTDLPPYIYTHTYMHAYQNVDIQMLLFVFKLKTCDVMYVLFQSEIIQQFVGPCKWAPGNAGYGICSRTMGTNHAKSDHDIKCIFVHPRLLAESGS